MLTRHEAIRILYGTAIVGWKETMQIMGDEYSRFTFKDVLYAMGVQEEEFNRVMRDGDENRA